MVDQQWSSRTLRFDILNAENAQSTVTVEGY